MKNFKKTRFQKLKMIIQLLRGKPLIYKMKIRGSDFEMNNGIHMMAEECDFSWQDYPKHL